MTTKPTFPTNPHRVAGDLPSGEAAAARAPGPHQARDDVQGAERYAEAVRRAATESAVKLTATLACPLGWVALQQGGAEELAGARELLEAAIGIEEEVRGARHLELARTMHTLAQVLKAQGGAAALDRARELLEAALGIQEEVVFAFHPVVAATMHTLAQVLKAQGGAAALARARELLERALVIQVEMLTMRHPGVVAMTKDTLVQVLQAQSADALGRARELLEWDSIEE